MNDIIYTLEYKDFVNSIIQKIQNAQYESLKLVNKFVRDKNDMVGGNR